MYQETTLFVFGNNNKFDTNSGLLISKTYKDK